MKVPDPELIAQVPDAPVSVRLSTMVMMDGDRVASFCIVMSGEGGKVLAKHPIGSLNDVVAVAANLARDAVKAWPGKQSW